MPVQDRYPKYMEDQRAFFDEKITEEWKSYLSPDWDYSRIFEVRQLFRRVRPATVLNVGCGCGFQDIVMAEYPFVERVDAIDYSEQSVRKADAEYPHPKIRRSVQDFSTFSAEKPYDLVVSFAVFEHFSKPEEYMNSCVRNCGQSGVVAICTPNRLRIDNFLRVLKGEEPILSAVMHHREYTAKEIYLLGREFGLRPLGYFGYGINQFVVFGQVFLSKLSIQHRMWAGYFLKPLATELCVLMRKV
jgi:2-polyprenyl-3-methyl-5-hydroxy-6-metoxy-1,4-benzoquinol methylase